ncbi:MAG: nuclear transport factor 2 family protein [Acidobacteria bacterium]|nr:nuclear transport factor 2 family protein [Acidobacteriota bacterium]
MNTPTELVQALFSAFGRGDIAFILNHVAGSATWISPGTGIPASGKYSGPAGAAQFFQNLAASEEITRFEPREFVAAGNNVIALGYEECTSRATGKKAATNWAMLFRVDGGKVTHWEAFYDTSAYAIAHAA